MFLRNNKDISNPLGPQIVNMGMPYIYGIPMTSLQSSGHNGLILQRASYLEYDPFKERYFGDKIVINVNKITYKPRDMFMYTLDCEALKSRRYASNSENDPTVDELLKCVKYCPASIALTKNGSTTYHLPLLVNIPRAGCISPVYLKFTGSREEFNTLVEKDFSTYLDSYQNNSITFGTNDSSGLSSEYYDLFSHINPGISITDLSNVEPFTQFILSIYKTSSNNDDVPYIRSNYEIEGFQNKYHINVKTELFEMTNALPLAMYYNAFDAMPFVAPRNIYMQPGWGNISNETGQIDTTSIGLFDFILKYPLEALFTPEAIDRNSGNNNSYTNKFNKSLYYGSLAMKEYDKSGNYITEITVNN